MENGNSGTKKSRLMILLLVGLVVAITAIAVSFYQSTRQAEDGVAVEAAAANADQKADNEAAVSKQNQPQKKSVAQKKESGSVLDKLKNVDIEVHGAKNPCTQTERMMKQCSD